MFLRNRAESSVEITLSSLLTESSNPSRILPVCLKFSTDSCLPIASYEVLLLRLSLWRFAAWSNPFFTSS